MWFDLLIAGILLYAIWKGASKGVVWQLAAIAALVLCFAFAESLSLQLAPMINVKPPLNRWIAMLVIYIVFSFISFTVARSLKSTLDALKFQEFDRHLGALLGLAKGIIFSLFLTFFVITISESARATVLTSHSGYAAAVILDELAPVMPAGFHDVLDSYLAELNHPDVPVRDRNPDEELFGDDRKHQGEQNPFPPGSNDLPNPFFRGSEGDGSKVRTTNQEPSLKEILKSIPVYLRGELEDKIIEAFNSTAPEDREEFARQLTSRIPGVLRGVAENWQNGQPDSSTTSGSPLFDANRNQEEKLNPERAVLLRDIAAIYSDYPEAQNSLIEEFEESLSGLPDQVVMAVLRDWRADVLLTGGDPDSKTDVTTPLDVRVLRQLELQRVSLDSLSSTLQSRLKNIQRR
ncbi:CvpA family protein [Gimesia aquarii]|uniref:Colicin V production protein n=1 Tax=Gimesia aquarii TaxID=2527964 RepID=A0A517WW40_9PLAN|nr:CvpA family protein [Gimesia aquarii]QDU09477.1 Colicin V production protein [Gimesia aquarii]